MAYLAIRCSSRINAVSQLHARVARDMWRRLWPGHGSDEVPIVGITNGIDTRTWTAADTLSLTSPVTTVTCQGWTLVPLGARAATSIKIE